MAHCKNVIGPAASAGGSPEGDGGGDPPRRLSTTEKGKGKKLATKKRKASDREAFYCQTLVHFYLSSHFFFSSRFRALALFYFLVFTFFSEHSPSWNNVASGSNQNISSIYFTGNNRDRIMFLAILSWIGVE